MRILNSLKNLLDDECVLTDSDSLQTYGKDWTKIHQADPFAIVFPKTTEQVQALVKFANQEILALVPSGCRPG